MKLRAARPGFSLIEMVVVVALVSVLGGAVASALIHQQRFASDTADLMDARTGVRDAIEVMSADIRGSSSADTIRLMADSALELFASIGASTVCRAVSATTLALADESANGTTLTSILLPPDTGDLALIYSDTADASGGRWRRHRIAAFGTKSGTAGCLPAGPSHGEGFSLTFQTVAGDVRPGTPIRFIRRGRYSLYRSSDRHWYLGYRRCNALGASVCGSIQPVSGPYRPYSTDPEKTGLLLSYFDARGEALRSGGPPLSVVRVDITARASSKVLLLRKGSSANEPRSAHRSVAIRNR